MARVNGNQMVISHFNDFYFLEALQAGLRMAKSANEELGFRHSVEKLEHDIDNEFTRLTKSMALRIYVYLWSAALGEARHANSYCDMAIHELYARGRDTVYELSLEYMPVGANYDIVRRVYAQDWNCSSFGGKKWLEIVEGMGLYGTVSDAAFIDHAVDLEHNGGCVFNKNSSEYTNFYCYGEFGYEHLHKFLDWKFSHDILNTIPVFYYQCQRNHDALPVSRKVYSLITRYNNVIRPIVAVHYTKPMLENLSDYSVEWGNETLQTRGEETATTPTATVTKNGKFIFTVKRNFWELGDGKCGIGSVHQMHQYAGKTLEFSKHGHDGYMYYISQGWNWCPEWLEGATEERHERREHERCSECGGRLTDYDSNYSELDERAYCNDCYSEKFTQRLYCRKCDEYYSDIEYHNRHKHTRREYVPAELAVDADGIFEITQLTGDIVPQSKLEALTFAGQDNKKRTVEVEVYSTIVPQLVVYSTHEASIKMGNRPSGFVWAIHHKPTGRLLNPHCETWQEAVEKANKLADFDWTFTDDILPHINKLAIMRILGYGG